MAGLCIASVTNAQEGNEKINNIVLVHGAFTDGSCWNAVTVKLQALGYHVTAVQNSLTSLKEDVTITERVLARQKGNVLLVGHSWGGAVITQAGNDPRVKGLVYLSAILPDSGESASDALARHHNLPPAFRPDENGLIWLDEPEIFRKVMANDIPQSQARILTSVQQPIASSAFNEKITHAAWHEKPVWYVLTENDQALSPDAQRHFAKESHAITKHINAGHLSMISHPDDIVRVISGAAEELSSNKKLVRNENTTY
ncbi:alpha/beta hydrolase [Cronobacter dublinensis]|uniref:alpha/beta hydrolase n=1 Tax=Cronobacter dublinensis TaxID=413497 RepID=UPI00300E0FC5